ncbi:unnamed protein product [Trichobilharzia regenti]|nr:unnamed protein product [Trichobilharzia regenti]
MSRKERPLYLSIYSFLLDNKVDSNKSSSSSSSLYDSDSNKMKLPDYELQPFPSYFFFNSSGHQLRCEEVTLQTVF